MSRDVPTPALGAGPHRPARSIARILQDPFGHWPAEVLMREAVEGATPGGRYAIVASRELIGTILANRDERFPRARVQDRVLGTAYGENLIRGDKVDWREQRRLIARPISTSRAASLMPKAAASCARTIAGWRAQGAHAPDLAHDLRFLSLDALWQSLFSAYGTADVAIAQATAQFASAPSHKLTEELAFLAPLAEIALAHGAGQGFNGGETGASVDRNTLILFLHAGHDNIAAAMRWMLWLLASRPDLQDRIRAEAVAVGEAVEQAMPVTEAVILETLRLYPPIPQIARDVTVDIEADGRVIEAGFTAFLSIYALHRSRRYWHRPDEFVPERFLDGTAGGEARRNLLLPFGAGQRGCIGASLARLELKLFLSQIVAAFALQPNGDEPMLYATGWVIRPTTRAPVVVKPR